MGLGYQMGVWIGKNEETVSGKLLKPNPDPTQDPIEVNINQRGNENLAMLTHIFYPKIGLHYYYGNHQFNVAYKFGGLLSGTKAERIGGGTTTMGGSKSKITQSIQSSPSYISFGYSYRF